ncbi:MAG: alpha/beta fold hydrolase [Myxococcota bacterium]
MLALPASRKTRALLAYLALTGRPQRRDRLCEVFWELPDDPRAALRWSLSKIRRLVNHEQERLVADRERVNLTIDDVDIDLRELQTALEKAELNKDELESIAARLESPVLDGEDLSSQPIFQQWLTNERTEARRLRARAAERLATHASLQLDERLPWAKLWLELRPFSSAAVVAVLALLRRLEREQEREELEHELRARFARAEIEWPKDDGTDIATEFETQGSSRELLSRQQIRFCTADDGVRIAYASVGEGAPIVKAANWLSHLELDWDAPIWSPLFRELARDHQFIRYDERGNGLSDWEVQEISFGAFVRDLETVVEALGLTRFPLLGISQGAAVSIEYAIRHPDRVSHLILFGGYPAGWRVGATPELIREREAIITLTETGWGRDNPAYRQIFSSTFMPSATAEELAWFNEFQRRTTSPENAARFLSAFGDIDVRSLLKRVTVPTLVLHALGDRRIPVETGRRLAAEIPNAQFVGLETDGHLLLGRESASRVFVSAVREFLRR